MGIISYEDLQINDRPRSPAEALSGSSPIGGRPISDIVQVIAVVRDQRGELVFGPEVTMQAAQRRKYVKTRQVEWSWLRLEFKADRRRIATNSTLILAEHPRSSFWWDQARFRSVSKKNRDERSADEPAELETDDPEVIIRHLESLKYDPWETDGRYLTAGISKPARTMRMDRAYEKKVKALQLCGVTCFDLRELGRELFKSKRAQALLKMTENRSIKLGPSGSRKARARLREETIEEAHTLLHCAIQQAFAGPHRNSEKWIDRPVIELADHIYRDHLYNAHRRTLRRKRGTTFDEQIHSPGR